MALSDWLAAAFSLFRPTSTPPVSPSSAPGAAPAPAFVMPSAANEKPEVAAPSWIDLCRPLTQHFEQCRLVAYWDATGKRWTCGWGTTGPDVCEGTVWTQATADSRLEVRLNEAADVVDTDVHVSLTPAQKAALTDFVYNCGGGNFRSSTLLRLLNAGDYQGAADQFPLWNKSGGVVLGGLVARRKAERDLFLTGAWSAT